MPHFCIFDSADLPIVRVSVESRPKETTRDGFRLRYRLELRPDVTRAHVDGVIDMIDDAMGPKTKAHGLYQAKYAEVREAYGRILDVAKGEDRLDVSGPLRGMAVILAIGMFATMCFVIPSVTAMFLLITLFKKQSGFAAMAEAAILAHIFDWRPTIRRLFHYANTGEWPYG